MRGRKGLVSFELRETAPRVFEVEHVWETRADWEAWLNDRYARAHVCEGVRTRARSQEQTARARARIRANAVLTTSTTFSLAHARARACVCVRAGALFLPPPLQAPLHLQPAAGRLPDEAAEQGGHPGDLRALPRPRALAQLVEGGATCARVRARTHTHVGVRRQRRRRDAAAPRKPCTQPLHSAHARVSAAPTVKRSCVHAFERVRVRVRAFVRARVCVCVQYVRVRASERARVCVPARSRLRPRPPPALARSLGSEDFLPKRRREMCAKTYRRFCFAPFINSKPRVAPLRFRGSAPRNVQSRLLHFPLLIAIFGFRWISSAF